MDRLLSAVRRRLVIGLVGLALLALVLALAQRSVLLPPPILSVPASPNETMVGRIVEVTVWGGRRAGQPVEGPRRLRLQIERGSLAGQEVVIEPSPLAPAFQEQPVKLGDRVYVERMPAPDGDRFYASDIVRTHTLVLVAGLFAALVLLMGRGKGLRSLGGTLFSLAVIFGFIVPQILAGRDPLLVSIAGAIALLATSTYLVHGWNPKAHAALAGMALSLLLTGALAWLTVGLTRLSGLSSEEGTFLIVALGPGINLHRLLLGGIIIGALGVIDDICVGQAAAVFELVKANPDLSWADLFRHSLSIGRDHIAASVNTLLLAYAGASLPLLLVFGVYQEPLVRRLSREPIAEEIVRTLVGSTGLLLAMPITGLIASWMAARSARPQPLPEGWASDEEAVTAYSQTAE